MKQLRRLIPACFSVLMLTACQGLLPQPDAPQDSPVTVEGEDAGLVTSTPVPTVPSDTVAEATAIPQPEGDRAAPGTVILDQTAVLSILQTSQAEMNFATAAFQVIRLDVNLLEGALDYDLQLVDMFGNRIATLEPGIGSSVESINEFTLPYEGTYRLRIVAQDGAGTVQVVITALDVPSGGGQVPGFDSPITALMATERVYHTYQFALEQGQIVQISARGENNGAPDMQFVLYGPDGRYLVAVDDTVPLVDLNAVLSSYVAPLTGVYTAIVTNYERTQGKYQFSVNQDTEPPEPEGEADVVYNQVYRLNLVDGSKLNVTFDGRVGDALRIDVFELGEGLDADIRLYSPYDQAIAMAVDAGTGAAESIRELQLPYNGRYRLELSPIGSGTASLSITPLTVADLSGGGSFGEDIKAKRTGRFETNNVFHYYQFTGNFGDLINVSVVSTSDTGQIDIGFALIGPQGVQMVFADDSNGGASPDPELSSYRVEQTGTYTIIVYTVNNATGSYELLFSRQ